MFGSECNKVLHHYVSEENIVLLLHCIYFTVILSNYFADETHDHLKDMMHYYRLK